MDVVVHAKGVPPMAHSPYQSWFTASLEFGCDSYNCRWMACATLQRLAFRGLP